MKNGFLANLGATLKSTVKIALQSRRCTVKPQATESESCYVLGNGPSLADALRDHGALLAKGPSMAVNFAANTPEFLQLKPRYYILADPHFFSKGDPNVDKLWQRLENEVDWEMTLLIPTRAHATIHNPMVRVERYNPVGIEGFGWFENIACNLGLGMPRPRNVLIPAIMMAIRLGFKKIYVLGADHSWMKTLRVDDDNRVISVQPHFYEESDEEHERVAQVYSSIPLHKVVESFHIAFKAYHDIARYAKAKGVTIINATPGSMIDAFRRCRLS